MIWTRCQARQSAEGRVGRSLGLGSRCRNQVTPLPPGVVAFCRAGAWKAEVSRLLHLGLGRADRRGCAGLASAACQRSDRTSCPASLSPMIRPDLPGFMLSWDVATTKRRKLPPTTRWYRELRQKTERGSKPGASASSPGDFRVDGRRTHNRSDEPLPADLVGKSECDQEWRGGCVTAIPARALAEYAGASGGREPWRVRRPLLFP
jgi:hypothetical protein